MTMLLPLIIVVIIFILANLVGKRDDYNERL